MKSTISWLLFIGSIVFAALFVPFTADLLPQRIASHFDSAGQPNGFMSRSAYVAFMLVFSIGFPVFLVACLTAAHRGATASIKLPKREFWLAPDRRAATVTFLVTHGVWSGTLMCAFICFVHWQLVQANAVQPPHLSGAAMLSGMAALITGMALWMGNFLFRFRRR